MWQHIGVVFCEQFILICKSRSRNCYLLLGFSLYLNLLLNFFQLTKGLRLNSYPVSLQIFSSLPLAVNPVGLTTYWCYFSWIIVYNLVTIYSITTKIWYLVAPLSRLSVYQISRPSDNSFVFYSNFHTFMKRRKKNSAKFWRFISRKRLAWFSWNVRWWRWPAFPVLKSFSFIKVSRSYVYVKITLLFFLLITHECGVPASWAARHTTVCLDLFACLGSDSKSWLSLSHYVYKRRHDSIARNIHFWLICAKGLFTSNYCTVCFEIIVSYKVVSERPEVILWINMHTHM